MASLIESIELVEGDSSNVYTFGSDDFPDISSVNWDSSLVIREKSITGAVVLTRALLKNQANTRFVFQLTPTETDTLNSGRYYLSISVFNLSIDFRREVVQAPLVIKASGIL